MTPQQLKTSDQLLGKSLYPDKGASKVRGWHSSALHPGCLIISVPRTLKVKVSFSVSPPALQLTPKAGPVVLGVPSSDVKIRPWLVCKATFKCVAHTYKPVRAWQLPFLMPAHLCKEENGTWTQSSRDAEKVPQCDQRMDVPLNPLHSWMRLTPRLRDHWSFQIMLQPIHLSLLPKNQPRAIFTPATPF